MFDDRIMPGGNEIARERLGFLPKISEFQFFITHHARIRGATGLVFAREIIDDDFFELVSFIHHIVRKT